MVQSAFKIKAPPRRALKLKELGIYTLPDGKEYIASTLYAEGCCLYTSAAWEFSGIADLRVGQDGTILRMGKPTRWNIKDLRDSGRTASYPRPTLM